MKKILLSLFLVFLIPVICFAGTNQIIISGSADNPIKIGITEYNQLMGPGNFPWNSSNLIGLATIPTSGAISNFKVQVAVAPGEGKSWTFKIRAGNPIADTNLSVIISGTDTVSSLDTDIVSISAGDLVNISAVGTGTPVDAGAVYWTCSFTPDISGETILSSSSGSWDTSLYYAPLFGRKIPDSVRFDGQTLFPTSGTLKKFYITLSAAPGAGTSRTFKLEKNGVDSDVAITISGTDISGSDLVNSLSVVAGDKVAFNQTAVSGTPATAIAYSGVVFSPDTQGEWITAATTDDGLQTNPAITEYQTLACGDSILTATENLQYNLAQTTTAKAIYVALSADPGVSPDAWSFTLRKNGTTDTALTTTIVADDSTGSLVTDVAISDGDLLTTKIVPINSPATSIESQISYLFYNAPTAEPTTLNNCIINNAVIN